MNILPIPALDGGHLLTVTITTLYEKIMKKKPNPKIEATIHGVGFVFLFLLIIVVTFNDIMRIATQFM
jgi:regulator of sigma E protease